MFSSLFHPGVFPSLAHAAKSHEFVFLRHVPAPLAMLERDPSFEASCLSQFCVSTQLPSWAWHMLPKDKILSF